MRLRIIVKTSSNNPEGHHEGDFYQTFLVYVENSLLADVLDKNNRGGYSVTSIVGVEIIDGNGADVMEGNKCIATSVKKD